MRIKKYLEKPPIVIIICSTLFVWAAIMTFFYYENTNTIRFLYDELQKYEQTAKVKQEEFEKNILLSKQEIEKAKVTASEIVNAAHREAMKVKEEAENLRLMLNKELYKVFPDLQRFIENEWNHPASSLYIDGFIITHKRIKIRLINNTTTEIKPDFKIIFLNKYGFITGIHRESWWFDRIQPGEIRYVDYDISFKFGPPIYYTLE